MGGTVSMSDGMIHFTVTVEGLGEPHVINCVITSELALKTYDGDLVVNSTVRELVTRLSAELHKRLKEAAYG